MILIFVIKKIFLLKLLYFLLCQVFNKIMNVINILTYEILNIIISMKYKFN